MIISVKFPAHDWVYKLHFMKKALGLNNTQTANILNVSRGLVAAWLDGKKRPREPHFSKLDQVVRLLQEEGIDALSPRLAKQAGLYELMIEKPFMHEPLVRSVLRAVKTQQDELEQSLKAREVSLDALMRAQ